MSQTGWKLGVDLGHLLSIGRLQLPHMALTYRAVSHKVGGIAQSDETSFNGGESPKGDGGTVGEIYEEWANLRDKLQTICAQTATNLEEAGEAIVHIANAYADTDEDAARSMKNYWKNGTYGLASGDTPVDDEVAYALGREHS
jgi:hypothetical protein